ncbi:MAG: NAD(P)H-hydrate dehydratase, partial [Planctomycetaceae bacterium]
VSDLVHRLYAEIPAPLVVDADGLNCLAGQGLAGQGLERRKATAGPRVLTPHPTEFARLLGVSTAEVQADRPGRAAEFARRHGLVVLLKGAGSVITDGRRVAVNPTGNPGLATGGTGDVLTGLVTALLAQGWPAFEAAQLGAWLHCRAADLAVRELSEPGLIASDLPRWLGRAWLELQPVA